MSLFEDRAKEYGLEDLEPETPPEVVTPLSPSEWLKGHLYLGGEKLAKRIVSLTGPLTGQSYETEQAFGEMKKQLAAPGSAGAAALELQKHPDTGLTGFAGQLVETIPEIPAYMAAGTVAGVGLKAAEALPVVGRAASTLGGFIAPEAIEAAGLPGFVARTATHGAVTGAVLGAVTGPPGERLKAAGEEALGFAETAPVFGLAGRAIGKVFGLAAMKMRARAGVIDVPADYASRYELLHPEGFNSAGMAKYWAAKNVGEGWQDVVSFIRPKGSGGKVFAAYEPTMPTVIDKTTGDLENVNAVDTFKKADEARTTTSLSGAPKEIVQTKDGGAAAVPDYSPTVELSTLEEAENYFSEVLSPKAGTFYKSSKAAFNARAAMEAKGKIEGQAHVTKIGEDGYVIGVMKEPVEEFPNKTAEAAAAVMGEKQPSIVEEVQAKEGAPIEVKPIEEVPTTPPEVKPTELTESPVRSDTTKGITKEEALSRWQVQADKLDNQLAKMSKSDIARPQLEEMRASVQKNIDRLRSELNVAPTPEVTPVETIRPEPKVVDVTVNEKGKATTRVKKGIVSPERDRFRQEMLDAYKGTEREVDGMLGIIDVMTDAAIKRGEIKYPEEVYGKLFAKDMGESPIRETPEGQLLKKGEASIFITADRRTGEVIKASKAVYELYNKADFSTLVHETWHIWENMFASEQTRADLIKIFGSDIGKRSVGSLELTARAFERYWAEGTLTPGELKQFNLPKSILDVFRQFKEWMLNIYTRIRNTQIDFPLHPDLETIFRRELGLKEIPKLELARQRFQALEKEYNAIKGTNPEAAARVLEESSMLGKWMAGQQKEVPITKTETKLKKGPISEEGIQRVLDFKEDNPELIAMKHAALDKLMGRVINENAKINPDLLDRMSTEIDRLGDRLLEGIPKGEEKVKEFTEDFKSSKSVIDNAKIDDTLTKSKERAGSTALDRVKAKTKVLEIKLKQEAGAKITPTKEEFDKALGRMAGTAIELRDMATAWRYPAEEVTLVIPRGKLEEFATFLGMGKELDAAQRAGSVIDFYKTIYDKLHETVASYKAADIKGNMMVSGGNSIKLSAKDLPQMTEMMNRIADEVRSWKLAFQQYRPHMLKELPHSSMYKSVRQFVEDKLGYSGTKMDRWLEKFYQMQATIQHVAMRAPVASGAFELEVTRQNIGSLAMKDILYGNTDVQIKGWEHGVDAKGRPAKIERAYNSPGVNGYMELWKYDQKMGKAADDILWHYSSRTKIANLDYNEALSRAEQLGYRGGDAERIAQAVSDVRETLDYVYFKIRQDFIDRLPSNLTNKEMNKRVSAWEKDHPFRQNYIPRIREGDMVVAAFDPTTGDTLYHTMVYGGRKAASTKVEVQKMYPGARVEDFPSSGERARSTGMGTARAQQLIQRVAELATSERLSLDKQLLELRDQIDKAANPALAERLKSQLDNATASFEQKVQDHFLEIGNEYLKGMGIRGHFIARESPEGVPGYVTDLRSALTSYTEMYASYMGRQHFMRGIYDELGKLKGYGIWQDYVRNWSVQALQAPTKFDSAVGFVKQVAALKFLTSLKTPLVVTLDRFTNVRPMMEMYMDSKSAGKLFWESYKQGAEFVKWDKQVQRAVREARDLAAKEGRVFNERQALRDTREKITLPSGITREDATALLALQRNGFLDPVFTRVIVDDLKSELDALAPTKTSAMDATINSNWKKVNYWSSWLIGQAESYGRTSTAWGAYRMFKESGMTSEEAIKAAGRFVIDSHGYYNKHNVPLSMMQGVGKTLRIPYTFRVFEHHYVNLIGELLSIHGSTGKAVAMKSLGALAALGGVFALPFFPSLQKLSKWATGTDPEMNIRKIATDYTHSERLADLISYGLPGLSGAAFAPFNLRSSVEVGSIDWKELVFGAPGQAISDISTGISAAASGDWQRVAEKALPVGLANPVKAYQRAMYGAMGPSGEYMKEGIYGEPIKYTQPEAIMQTLGFTSTRLDKFFRREQALSSDAEYWQNKRKVIYGQLERAVNKGDEAGVQRVFDMVDKFNTEAMNASPNGGITLIGPKEIQQSLKDRKLTKKARRALDIGGPTWVSGPVLE